MGAPIYLDHHATTPVDPRVLEAMLPYFALRFGNPASRSHRFGWEAEEAVERARAQVAAAIGADPKEIVFTSGATEACNLALKGLLRRDPKRRRHLVTTAIEHRAVLPACERLAREGAAEVTVVPVPPRGVVEPEAVARALRPDTLAVSVMAANNEVGTLQPLLEIGRLCRQHEVHFHSDAAQALGKVPLMVDPLELDLVSLSAHKLYGPKGVGALYVRRRGRRVRIAPELDGGGQEGGLRSGTVAVPLAVGFGQAAELAMAELAGEGERLRGLRDRLLHGLRAGLGDVRVNGDLDARLPGNLNLSFPHIDGEALVVGLGGIAVSSGSACESAAREPSHVLKALGLSDQLAFASLRFGLGRGTTAEEVDRAVAEVVRVVERLRAISPLYELAQKGIDPAAAGWTG